MDVQMLAERENITFNVGIVNWPLQAVTTSF